MKSRKVQVMSGTQTDSVGAVQQRRRRVRRFSAESSVDVPLISIITVVYNDAAFLEQCIKSVVAQSYQNLEYIIIDGGSTDGTLDTIQRYGERIDFWLSESDSGIYEAMNKGIEVARGAWLYFLGADDVLAGPDVVAVVAPHLADNLDLVYGAVRYPDGKVVRSGIGPRTLLHNTVHHQGAFYNASLFRSWRYDESLQIGSDYELNLLLYRSGARCRRLCEIIAICGDAGVSQTALDEIFRETNAIRRRHVGAVLNAGFFLLFLVEFSLYRLVLALKSGWRCRQGRLSKGGMCRLI